MRKRNFFTKEEIGAGREWVLDAGNSDLSVMKLRKFGLAEGETRKFAMRSSEALIVAVSGELKFDLDGAEGTAERFDAIYLTNGGGCAITALIPSEVLVCEAPAEASHRSALIRRKDVEPVQAGGGCHARQVWNMVSPGGVAAERLILGYCEGSAEGGWTGWPPHEHGGKLEEIYYYYDIEGPLPRVLQIVSDDLRGQIEAHAAKSGDILAISSGYHPIIAYPGVKMKNLWFMAAVRPEDRDFGLIRLDPAFS